MTIVKVDGWRGMLVLSAVLALAVVGCTSSDSEPSAPPSTDAEVVLRISGSGTTTAILEATAAAFEAATPGYHLEILPGTGSSGGVEGVIDGVLDVAAVVRPLKDEEIASGVTYVEFGETPVAAYSHPSVSIAGVTSDQLKAIFSGQIGNWAEVGGPDSQIIVYVRDENDSSTKALREAVFGDAPFSDDVARVLTSQTQMLDAVAGTADSVGFGSWSVAVAKGTNVRPIAVDGVVPGDPAYSIAVPLGIGYRAERASAVQPLIDWLLSEQGQAALQQLDVRTAS